MKKIIYTIFLLSFTGIIHAQNNASPYSSIGLGDIDRSTFDRSTGLGGAGVALSGGRFLYNNNPAAYSFLDDRFFHLETSARYKSINYSGNAINQSGSTQSADLQIKKLTAAIKLKPKIGFSLGLLPFSNSNYSFYSQKYIQGSTTSVDAYNEGTGNITQAYVATSYKLRKNLSIGLQFSYLFGQLERNETLYNTITDSGLVTQNTISVGDPHFKLGFQYKPKVSKNWQLCFGGTGSLKTTIRTTELLNIKYGGNNVYNNEEYASGNFTLPIMATTGFAAIFKDKTTFTVDYQFQNWSNTNRSGISYQLVNSNKISAGIEFSKKLEFTDNYTNQRFLFERFFYQIGGYYCNAYQKIYGQQLTDYGMSAAFGVNSKRNTMGLIAGVEIGSRGTTANNLIRENYTQFNVTLAYRDIWFTSKKRYN